MGATTVWSIPSNSGENERVLNETAEGRYTMHAAAPRLIHELEKHSICNEVCARGAIGVSLQYFDSNGGVSAVARRDAIGNAGQPFALSPLS